MNRFVAAALLFPLAATAAPVPDPPQLSARSYVLYGYESGQTLAAKEPALRVGPASLTKVMLAYVAFDELRQGRIKLDGQDITGATAKELLTQHGVAFVPQGRNLFGQLSVYENLELGGITLGMKTTHERIPEVLELFPRVKERINSAASSLSGGEQKQLEVGRALLLRPKVLLIDEPSIGLSPLVVADVFRLLNIFTSEQVQGLYGLATVMPEQMTSPGLLAGVMLAWIALPFAIATWRFK